MTALDTFVGQLITELGAAINAGLVLIGDELGLYRAMADAGPLSPAELASAPTPPSATSASGSTRKPPAATSTYDPRRETLTLPPEQAFALADEDSPAFVPGAFQVALRRCGAPQIGRALPDRRRARLARARPRACSKGPSGSSAPATRRTS